MPHTVRDWMSRPVIVVDPDSSVSYALTLMCRRGVSTQKHNIHHLPVADEHGALVGLISTTDIFMAVEEGGWGEGKK